MLYDLFCYFSFLPLAPGSPFFIVQIFNLLFTSNHSSGFIGNQYCWIIYLARSYLDPFSFDRVLYHLTATCGPLPNLRSRYLKLGNIFWFPPLFAVVEQVKAEAASEKPSLLRLPSHTPCYSFRIEIYCSPK